MKIYVVKFMSKIYEWPVNFGDLCYAVLFHVRFSLLIDLLGKFLMKVQGF